mmetsp:Transcript_27834/g.70347  ORF Transcript_27834/g.70347 Transcript_27834/m.70347 type:complete len:172 (-) Transcript_27834:1323-1838(-)|eukprot:CAMPEP_0179005568 /NCGR_PEP_ID=MMETSP0795-20121207/14018_1 /TAXON_ID=88552 /ORGANISM="Amoebophrya sp., Strain Ameob2" /LENGTH=171 /DNA_ID=CAMNT_0020700127 /DNA_START=139 /DNA_END=654 /DNA_ORIENTATION=+
MNNSYMKSRPGSYGYSGGKGGAAVTNSFRSDVSDQPRQLDPHRKLDYLATKKKVPSRRNSLSRESEGMHHQQPQHNSGPDAHHLYHDRSNGLSSGGAGGGGGAHHYAYNQHHHGTSSAGLGMVNQTFIDCTTAIPEDLYKRLEYEANIDRGVHVPKKKSNGECVLMHTGVY